jgi:hypothetical protein
MKKNKKPEPAVAVPANHADEWETKAAAQTLMEAQKVKANPKLHRSAKKELAKIASHAKRASR